WFLLNAAPDIRAQIEANEVLWPQEGLRSSPIAGVALTGADVDAVAGLLTLRERHRFVLYATEEVQAVLAANPIFHVLSPDCVARVPLPLGRNLPLATADGAESGLSVEAFPVPGKVPLWLEREGEDPGTSEDGRAVGLEIAEKARRMLFIPGCAALTPSLAARLRGAPLVFFDGTLWRDDEMLRAGVGTKTGRRMGHMSMSGE